MVISMCWKSDILLPLMINDVYVFFISSIFGFDAVIINVKSAIEKPTIRLSTLIELLTKEFIKFGIVQLLVDLNIRKQIIPAII